MNKKSIKTTVFTLFLGLFGILLGGCDDLMNNINSNGETVKAEIQGVWHLVDVYDKKTKTAKTDSATLYFESCDTRRNSSQTCNGYLEYANQRYDFTYTCIYHSESSKHVSLNPDSNPLHFKANTYKIIKSVDKLTLDSDYESFNFKR
jgi:hypothetical protein